MTIELHREEKSNSYQLKKPRQKASLANAVESTDYEEKQM